MAETYRIERFSDLLTVPSGRRADCVKNLLLSLQLSELSGVPPAGPLMWTDDGDSSCTIRDQDGAEFLKLEVRHG